MEIFSQFKSSSIEWNQRDNVFFVRHSAGLQVEKRVKE